MNKISKNSQHFQKTEFTNDNRGMRTDQENVLEFPADLHRLKILMKIHIDSRINDADADYISFKKLILEAIIQQQDD